MNVQQQTEGQLSYSTGNLEQKGNSKRMKLAVDFAYTLNHAIVCTVTDPITDIPIGMLTQKMFGNDMEHAASHWAMGEVIGDFGAVPAVVGLQHFAPKAMERVAKIVKPVAKPFLERAAARSAKNEFKSKDIQPAPVALKERTEEIYQKELDHLPDAIAWTVISPVLNITTQKLAGNKTPIMHLAVGKALGSTVTSALTVGVRNISPRHAQKWDQFLAGKVIGPVSSTIAHMFGVDKEKVKEGVEARQDDAHGNGKWSDREILRNAEQPSQPTLSI